MSVIVAVVGWALTGFGILSVIRPKVLVRFLSLPNQFLFPWVIISRLVIGAALIGAAVLVRAPGDMVSPLKDGESSISSLMIRWRAGSLLVEWVSRSSRSKRSW